MTPEAEGGMPATRLPRIVLWFSSESRALASALAVGFMIVAFDAAVRGRVDAAVLAVACAAIVLAMAESPITGLPARVRDALSLAFFWTAATVDLGIAVAERRPIHPALLALPVAAFAGRRPWRAWMWAGLSLASVAAVSLLGDRTEGVIRAALEIPGLLLLGSCVVVIALAGSLLQARAALLERRLEGESAERSRAEALAVSIREERGRQVADVSHEMRTPLHGVIGLLELVLRSELPVAERRQLEWALNSAESLLSLLDDLLDLDRIGQGRFRLRSRPFALHELVEGVERILAPRARSKGLSFETVMATDAPRFVVGDDRRLRQVLLNLAGNAVKFTRRGGVQLVVIATPESDERSRLRFEVLDTGPGLSALDSRKLFERYSRGSQISDRHHPSSGLGLSISRELSQAMGGELGAEERPSGGSRFWLEIALGVATAAEADTTSARLHLSGDEGEAPREATRRRILVVEDDPIVRELTLAQLRVLGCAAEAVSRGEEALERLAAQPFDAVLMDLEIEGIDGLETTKRLRALERGERHTVVLALSGRGFPEEQAACLEAGMDECLRKPTSLAQLEKALDEWLGPSATPEAAAAPEVERVEEREPRLDPVRLDDLASLGRRTGTPLLRPLVESFEGRSRDLADGLAQAIAAGDAARIKTVAHTLAGVAANLGAVRVARLGRALEAAARAGQLGGMADLLPQVDLELRAARDLLRERLQAEEGAVLGVQTPSK